MSKVTSLGQQLKKLQVPQVKWMLSNEKRRVSFLYDPKEASALDSESLHCLAINGLDQLKLIDSQTFSIYEETLFNQNSIGFERAVQTKDINENLNSEIKKFMLQLSPYFLLKPAHKVLEWLVFKYQIHIYNVNELFMCILPYHETTLFIRALQMINLDDHKQWLWLENNQKTGTPLSAQTLAQHVLHDLSFLNFIITYTNESQSIFGDDEDNQSPNNTNGINLCSTFVTKALIQAIDQNQGKINDAFIAQLLPFIYALMKPQHNVEFKSAGFLISSYLFQKCVFLKDVTEKTIYSIVKSIKSDAYDNKSALIAICLIIKSQKNKLETKNKLDFTHESIKSRNFISKAAIKRFKKVFSASNLFGLIDSLIKDECNIDEFLFCLFDRLVLDFTEYENQKLFEESIEFNILINLLNEITVDEKLIDYFVEMLFNLLAIEYSKLTNDNSDNNEEIQMTPIIQFIIELLKKLENRYPAIFDSTLNRILIRQNQNDELAHNLQQAVTLFSFKFKSTFKYNYLNNIGTNVILALESNNSLIRSKALDYVLVSYLNNNNIEIDADYIKNQIENKLKFDSSLLVFKSIIKLKLNLLKLFDEHQLVNLLYDKLFNNNDEIDSDDADSWVECKKQTIEFLFNDLYEKLSNKNELNDVFMNVACKTIESKSIQLLNSIKYTQMFKDNFQHQVTDSFEFDSLFNLLVQNPKFSKSKLDSIELNLKTFLLFEISSDRIQLFNILKNLNQYLSIKQRKKEKFEAGLMNLNQAITLDDYLRTIEAGKLENSIYIRMFFKLIEKLDYDNSTEVFEYLSLKSINRNLLHLFLIDHLLFTKVGIKTADYFLRFLVRHSTGNFDLICVQLRCIQLLNLHLKTELIDKTILILSYYLTSPFSHLRTETLKCFDKLKAQIDEKSTWYTFCKKILKHQEEIIADSSYLLNGSLFSRYLNNQLIDKILDMFAENDHDFIYQILCVFQNVSSTHKIKFIDSMVKYLESNNEKAMNTQLVINNYVLINNCGEYFNENEEKFELIMKKYVFSNLNIGFLKALIGSFSSLNDKLKLKLIEYYFDLYQLHNNEITRDSFINLLTDSSYFIHLFKQNYRQFNDEMANLTTTKDMRLFLTSKKEPTKANDLTKMKLILELIQTGLISNTINNRENIIKYLFLILNLIFNKQVQAHDQNITNDDQLYEYLEMTTINCLTLIYSKYNQNVVLNESEFNIELLMQLLKMPISGSILVQQKILILLSEISNIFADTVLEHVIIMFVFVGDKLARKDDQFSFEIINKTIENILPAILKAKTKETKSNEANLTVSKILQSFVVALKHIPAHRKWIIFSKLLNIINVDSYLWITVIQYIDFYLIENKNNHDKLKDHLKQAIQSYLPLYVQFESNSVIKSTTSIIQFISDYFFEKLFSTKPKEFYKYEYLACNLGDYSQLEDKYLVYHMVMFLNELFTSENLRLKINHYDNTVHFEVFLEKLLTLVLGINRHLKTLENNDDIKFTKSILNKIYDCMENALSCLDTSQFINCVKKLLKHENLQIKRRVLALLNNKLRKSEPSENEISLLLTLIDDLLVAIQFEQSNEVEINNQTILFSIKLLCKRIGDKHSLAFIKVLKFLCENYIDKNTTDSMLASKKSNFNLLSSVLLCLGELCFKLKSSCLIYLNKIVKFILDILKQSELLTNELLVTSCITCLLKIVQNLSQFLSPYLKRILFISCSIYHLLNNKQTNSITSNHLISISSEFGLEMQLQDQTQVQQTSNAKTLIQLDAKLSLLRNTLATQIPLRLLTPILNEESNFNSNMDIDNIEYYMQIMKLAIKNSNQEDIIANIKQLKSIFMNLFNLRTQNSQVKIASFPTIQPFLRIEKQNFNFFKKSPNELSKYEDFVIDAFSELTFKLSEELFRPMFFKLFEWATVNNPPKDRLITFYRITFKLSEKLKNLFVLFVSHFIQNAIQTLDLINKSKHDENFFYNKNERVKFTYINEKSSLLLFSLIDTLSNVFLHDSERVILGNDRFNLIMQPLVDQIENEIEFDNYKTFIDNHLSDCIKNFAGLCANDDTLCRKLNYQILLKTKHNSVQVSFKYLFFSTRISFMLC